MPYDTIDTLQSDWLKDVEQKLRAGKDVLLLNFDDSFDGEACQNLVNKLQAEGVYSTFLPVVDRPDCGHFSIGPNPVR